jgi:ABC-type nitrate/sulfonate/bicarbonate transport system substrate-binding protein
MIMNRRNRLFLSVSIPVLLLVIVGALFLHQQQAANSANLASATPAPNCHGKLTPLKFAPDWTPNTNHTGIYVAKEKGWYAAQCIALLIQPYSANVSSDTLVSSGQAAVGISSTESIVADAAVNQPVVSIAAIIQHNTSALVTLASSNLNSPRDLDGKIYGGFGAPYEGAVVGAIIRKAGGKGTFQNVTLNIDTMQALETKQIDFAWVFEGWEVIQAERAGFKLNVFPITSYGIPDYYTPNIITSPQEMKQDPGLLRRFMVATAQGYNYARTHAKEAAQMLIDGAGASNFPDQGLVFASQDFLSAHYVDSGRTWGWQDAAAWQGYPNFMLRNRAILDANNQPLTNMNFNALYTNQFLR